MPIQGSCCSTWYIAPFSRKGAIAAFVSAWTAQWCNCCQCLEMKIKAFWLRKLCPFDLTNINFFSCVRLYVINVLVFFYCVSSQSCWAVCYKCAPSSGSSHCLNALPVHSSLHPTQQVHRGNIILIRSNAKTNAKTQGKHCQIDSWKMELQGHS